MQGKAQPDIMVVGEPICTAGNPLGMHDYLLLYAAVIDMQIGLDDAACQ